VLDTKDWVEHFEQITSSFMVAYVRLTKTYVNLKSMDTNCQKESKGFRHQFGRASDVQLRDLTQQWKAFDTNNFYDNYKMVYSHV
jgi:hypothetical protein